MDDVHNGLTFCVGSYASSNVNAVEAMAEKFAPRTHFVHLRNVRRLDDRGSFVESDHLDGEVRNVCNVCNGSFVESDHLDGGVRSRA